MIYFILGGARSGKSRYAEKLAAESGKEVIYLATAQADDEEMKARILHHRNQRPAEWQTLEEPLNIEAVIADNSDKTRCVLIDCLTLWLTNILCARADVATFRQGLLNVLNQTDSDVILVSNETGMGVVPLGELTRRYCDEMGWLHQEVAALADQVVLMVAGIPMVIKSPPTVQVESLITPSAKVSR